MNKVQLVGRVTGNPEIRYSEGGMSVTRFTLAVDRRWKCQGEKQAADFITCVSFGKTAEFVEKYFQKGSRMGLTGRIQTGSYEKEGSKVYTMDVIAEAVEFVENKHSDNGSDSPSLSLITHNQQKVLWKFLMVMKDSHLFKKGRI